MLVSNLCEINYNENFLNYILQSSGTSINLRVVVSLPPLEQKYFMSNVTGNEIS